VPFFGTEVVALLFAERLFSERMRPEPRTPVTLAVTVSGSVVHESGTLTLPPPTVFVLLSGVHVCEGDCGCFFTTTS